MLSTRQGRVSVLFPAALCTFWALLSGSKCFFPLPLVPWMTLAIEIHTPALCLPEQAAHRPGSISVNTLRAPVHLQRKHRKGDTASQMFPHQPGPWRSSQKDEKHLGTQTESPDGTKAGRYKGFSNTHCGKILCPQKVSPTSTSPLSCLCLLVRGKFFQLYRQLVYLAGPTYCTASLDSSLSLLGSIKGCVALQPSSRSSDLLV